MAQAMQMSACQLPRASRSATCSTSRAASTHPVCRPALWQPQHAQRTRQRRADLQVVAGQPQAPPQVAPRTQDMAGDPFGLLLRQRIVFLGGEVNDFSADAVISQLLLLDSQSPNKDIKLFINSPGGSVTAGMGIYDAMMMCRCDVQTYCFGLAASMGAFLLGAGTKDKRYSMPNARIMIHQPLGGASGQAVDIEIQAREIMYHKNNLNQIMADYTGQPFEKLEEDTDRDRYMSPLEAKSYGLIDHVIGGDDAGFKFTGSTTDFPKTKEDYVNWGDFADDDTRTKRFQGVPLEPYTQPLAPDERKENGKKEE